MQFVNPCVAVKPVALRRSSARWLALITYTVYNSAANCTNAGVKCGDWFCASFKPYDCGIGNWPAQMQTKKQQLSTRCPCAVNSLLWQQVAWRLKQHVVQQVRGRVPPHTSDSIPLVYFNPTGFKVSCSPHIPCCQIVLEISACKIHQKYCVLNLAFHWPTCPAWSPVCLLGHKHTRFMPHCGKQMHTSGLGNTKMKACNIKLEINRCTTKVIISYEC